MNEQAPSGTHMDPHEPIEEFSPFIGTDRVPTATILDFWRWAHSDLLMNSERGLVAEFVVGLALDCLEGTARTEWDSYDLLYRDKYKIEVKSSAYLQNWAQKAPSSIRFGVSPHVAWDGKTGEQTMGAKRWADVYVFCVFETVSRENANPQDLSQWTFYVASAKRLDEILGEQKSIGLEPLKSRVKPYECDFKGLRKAVDATLGLTES